MEAENPGPDSLPAADTGPEPGAWWRGSRFARALDLVYPVQCLGCSRPLSFSPWRHLCPGCIGRIQRLGPANSCPRCAEPLGPHTKPGNDCPACRTRDLRFTRAAAAAKFESPLRELVHALKFSGNLRAAQPLGGLLAGRLRESDWLEHIDALVPVPLHPRRLRERGYNQSLLIARAAGEALRLPVRARALARVRDILPQTALGREERLRNPRQAFEPGPEAAGLASPLLVDDVMTTGATVSECAAALRAVGCARVYAAAAGR